MHHRLGHYLRQHKWQALPYLPPFTPNTPCRIWLKYPQTLPSFTRELCSTKVSTRTSWGRMATRLKLHDSGGIHGSGGGREVGKGEKYLEHVKEQSALSPEESLLKLQEQVQEEMASALSRTGAKLEDAYSKMIKSRIAFELAAEEYAETKDDAKRSGLREMALEFNDLRKKAEYARWQLLIHRQALGFIHKNHVIVQEAYPLPKPIKEEEIP